MVFYSLLLLFVVVVVLVLSKEIFLYPEKNSSICRDFLVSLSFIDNFWQQLYEPKLIEKSCTSKVKGALTYDK
jgi:hypothetical protein